jgi:hypothetical protein
MKKLVVLGISTVLMTIPLKAQVVENKQHADTLLYKSSTAVVGEGKMKKRVA